VLAQLACGGDGGVREEQWGEGWREKEVARAYRDELMDR